MGQPSKKTWLWIVGAAVGMIGLAGCGNSTPPPFLAPVPTSTATPTTSAAVQVVDVVLPEIAGKNGRIAMDELRKLGLTNVVAASRDRYDTPVVSPENWTVLSIHPSPGTLIRPDTMVIVTMIKRGTVVPVPAPEPPLYAPEPDRGSSVYYPNCSAAKAAGAAPLYAGEPGYSSKLDRDSDGIACES